MRSSVLLSIAVLCFGVSAATVASAQVATSGWGQLRCWNGRCNYDWGVSVVSVSPPVAYAPMGGLFPPSIEQQLGVAPNECFVDDPASNGRKQVACSLTRPIEGYFDTPGGRAVLYSN